MDISLTNREADVMRVLWDHGPSVVAEVRERLTDELAYTTVLTILRTLETKGYVVHQEEGRVHRYCAAVKEQAAQRSALRHLTQQLFNGPAELLFTRNRQPGGVLQVKGSVNPISYKRPSWHFDCSISLLIGTSKPTPSL
jgi:predicted transcriptional regulator